MERHLLLESNFGVHSGESRHAFGGSIHESILHRFIIAALRVDWCAFAQSRMDQERERRRTQVEAIKTLLAQENIRAKIRQELDSAVRGSPH